MKTWSAIFNIIAVMLLMMLLVIYRNTSMVIEREFQEARLKQAVEYAAEAAFIAALEVEDIDIEYDNIDAVVINPGESLDIFESLMCLNYNMSASDENKAHIESYIPTAVLACNDGYYILTLSEVDTTPTDSIEGNEYRFKWSVKKPYIISNNTTDYSIETIGMNELVLNGGAYINSNNELVLPNVGATATLPLVYTDGDNWEINYNVVATGESERFSPLGGILLGSAYYDSAKNLTVAPNGYSSNGHAESVEIGVKKHIDYTEPNTFGASIKYVGITLSNNLPYSSPNVVISDIYMKIFRPQNGNRVYAVNLNNRNWVAAAGNIGSSNVSISSGDDYTEQGITKEEVLREINNRITKDMLYQIDANNFNKKSWDYKFYLPSIQTSEGINPITKPSLLIFMQGVDFASTQRLDVVNVAGLTTERKRVVVAFTDPDTSIKYYCYEGQIPDSLMSEVNNFYSTIEEAAEAGYIPNYEYLSRKID